MKKICLTFITLIAVCQLFGQQTLMAVNVGEEVPDVLIENILDYNGDPNKQIGSKIRMKDLRGKLVILDFWTHWCGSCIEGFPKMSALQEKYKNKIQILLVNPDDDANFLKQWIAKNNKDGRKIIPENLTIVAEAKLLNSLFPPRRATGYHVWIDHKGKVVLRGISQNTYDLKIDDFLAGKEISFVTDNARKYNAMKPLFSPNSESPNGNSLFSSAMSSFSDTIADPYGQVGLNIVDSTHGTIRNTFANFSLHGLYRESLVSELKKDSKTIHGNRLVLQVEDSSKVTSDEGVYGRKVVDSVYRNSGYCYEQVVPLSTPDSARFRFMKEDLDRFFLKNKGMYGEVKKMYVACYKIIRISNIDKLKSHSKVRANEVVTDKNGRISTYYKGSPLDYVLNMEMGATFYNPDLFNPNDIIVNETNYDGPVDIFLPSVATLKSLSEIRDALRKYDLDIIKGHAWVDMLVISEPFKNKELVHK